MTKTLRNIKEIKKSGNYKGIISLDADDFKAHDLKVGDFLDISDIMKVKKNEIIKDNK